MIKISRKRYIIERKNDDLLKDLIDFGKVIWQLEEQQQPTNEKMHYILRERDKLYQQKNYPVRRSFVYEIDCGVEEAVDGKLVEFALYSDSDNYAILIERDGERILDNSFASLHSLDVAIGTVIATTDRHDKYVFNLQDFTFDETFKIVIRTVGTMVFRSIFIFFKLYKYEAVKEVNI